MEVVALHLAEEALRLTRQSDRDLFGRSAFNRFYYATFLIVRSQLHASIGNFPTTHSAIPEFLTGSVTRELSKGAQYAKRADDAELSKLCSRARTATKNLADILRTGYSVRVIADYKPEILIEFENVESFGLNTVLISEAKAWPHKALAMSVTLSSAWKQLHA